MLLEENKKLTEIKNCMNIYKDELNIINNKISKIPLANKNDMKYSDSKLIIDVVMKS